MTLPILDLLGEHKEGLSLSRILQELGGKTGERESLRKKLQGLERQGLVLRLKKKYFLSPGARRVTGSFVSSLKGYGFVIPDKASLGDIFIPARHTGGAVQGDMVEVQCVRGKRAGKPEGRVLRIVKKGKTSLVGIYRERSGQPFFISTETASSLPTSLELGKSIAPDQDSLIRVSRDGYILQEVFGHPDEEGVDLKVILHNYGLKRSFPPAVISEVQANEPRWAGKEGNKRKDFTQWTTVTIDGEDARDFDDAVSIAEMDDGQLLLGVHIADVSDYIDPGTSLDDEAFRRGRSVYFPDVTIPMLPERLSFDLCSLMPGKKRRTVSVLMTLDPKGRVLDVSFHLGIIRTRARLTYTSVQKIFNGERVSQEVSPGLVNDLFRMKEAAGRLRKNRIASGSLDIDYPEPELVRREGEPLSVVAIKRNEAHRLIEEFMLGANEAAASFLAKNGIPLIYRVHPPPLPEDISRFRDFLLHFGYSLPEVSSIQPNHLQRVLDEVRGSSLERIVSMKMLRSLQLAVYSEENQGHFGLGKELYAHFTSPIRRYPDLVVHRLLKNTLRKEKMGEVPLAAIAAHCTEKERQGDEAERDLLEWRIFKILKSRLGDETQGTVTGFTKAGLTLELDEYFVEGTIGFMDLPRDVYSRRKGRLIGRRTGRQYEPGQKMTVKIVSVDPLFRKMTLIPV